ncbi:hypothetical protein E2C01_043400 [Portunus trituberculatus]|uniref:Uncharacterized protein n=1 Tax=Portunus trituberculatus TaxID=210409 RepID=A0A5B7FSV3_PORTR|nr:hypothetical protein [Portunus trituberculatus]
MALRLPNRSAEAVGGAPYSPGAPWLAGGDGQAGEDAGRAGGANEGEV